MFDNLILLSDSYKSSHFKQYPSGTSQIYSYFESRGSTLSKDTVFFGLQYLLKHYLEGRVIDGLLLQEERKRKEALGEAVLLPSIYNNVMKQRIRNFFLFGLITAEQEQDLYQKLKK